MADSLHRKIWNALKTKVVAAQGVGQPLANVKTNSFFEGVKTTIPSGAMPAITMEVDKVTEQRHTAPGKILATFGFKFHCMVENVLPENQVAATGVFGIVDLVENLKNVLTADQKLGLLASGVLRVNIPSVDYFVDNYPIRDAMVNVEVEAVYQDAAR
jgi:hypothetical protein